MFSALYSEIESAVQCSTVQYSAVQYNVHFSAEYSAVAAVQKTTCLGNHVGIYSPYSLYSQYSPYSPYSPSSYSALDTPHLSLTPQHPTNTPHPPPLQQPSPVSSTPLVTGGLGNPIDAPPSSCVISCPCPAGLPRCPLPSYSLPSYLLPSWSLPNMSGCHQ